MQTAPRPERRDKVALLVNVRSRKARRDRNFVPTLEALFADHGRVIESKSPGELPEALADVRRSAPDILFVCGGDGTLRQTLSHLIASHAGEALPKIAILRGGTMNTVATSLGIFRPPVPHVKILLDRLDRGLPLATVQRNLLSINRHFGFIFAVGGFSRFIEQYTEHSEPTPQHGFRLILKTIFSALVKGPLASTMFQKFNVSVWRDQKPLLQNTLVTNIAASAIRHIGFGFQPFYGAEITPEEFGLLVLLDSPAHMLKHAVPIYRGEPVDDSTIVQLPAREVLIKLKEPMRSMLDGDLLRPAKEFVIRAGPSIDMVVG